MLKQNELVQLAIQGDESILENLLLQEYPGLLRFIRARLPAEMQSRVAAEDVIQETFVMVFRDIKRFRPNVEIPFSAWVQRIARNRLSDLRRRFRRLKRGGAMQRVEKTQDPMQSSLVTLIHQLAGTAKTPSRIIARDEAVDSLRLAISRLPMEQRQAIEFYYLKNLGIDATAREMKRTTDSVRGLLHRAKKSLQQNIHESIRWYGAH